MTPDSIQPVVAACNNCRYWKRFDHWLCLDADNRPFKKYDDPDNPSYTEGSCRQNSPGRNGFPKTKQDVWCGKYQAK